MDTHAGTQKELLETFLRRVDEPIVTLPSRGLTYDCAEALAERDDHGPVQVLLGEHVESDLRWTTRARLADVQASDRGAVRVGTVTDIVVAGQRRVATLDRGVRPSIGYVGRCDARGVYERRWDAAESAALDTCGLETLSAEVAESFGPTAAEVATDVVSRRARGVPDPVSLLVWVGAVAETTTQRVIEVADRLGVASRRTVHRRVEEFQSEGLVQPVPTESDGIGRPERRLHVAVELPEERRTPEPLVSALAQ